MKLWKTLFLVAGLAMTTGAFAVQVSSDLDYLPQDVTYDPAIPRPEAVLGYPVGTWHVRHDQIVSYLYRLAEASPRIEIEEMGRSHEQRPILLLTISSPDNLNKVDSLRQAHLKSLHETVPQDTPLMLWMGYSVHGNEPSGANAGLLVAYYLAAAQGPEIDKLLSEAVILLEPALNPDGLSRFAQWANMHKGENLVADANHREHWEAWPSGRTNHYWFDLNRDWLLLTHPESRARIAQYHRWRPHVLTDFHEMGTDSTFFFQPGIPSRKNPWTPYANVELTNALGEFHAAALDRNKQLYFTQEGFDDFYYGKGSTYPDAHGSIGILFEQASSRGHLQESIHGPLSFPATIQNQVTTSLSTFAGALANADTLKQYQRGFANETAKIAKADEMSGYLLSEGRDSSRFRALLDILKQHQIQLMGLEKDVERNGRTFAASQTVFVPLAQPQYRLIKSIFSTRTSFKDNTFYDVSNWNLPLAFNIDYQPVERGFWRKLPLMEQLPVLGQGQSDIQPQGYAYAFSWQDSNAPRLLQELLEAGFMVKAASSPFTALTTQGKVAFESGTMVIPSALKQPQDWTATLARAAEDAGIRVWTLESGLTPEGNDLGSRSMDLVELPKVLLVGGEGTSQYEVGEIWHYLDQRVGLPATIVDMDKLAKVGLEDYSHLILADGNYSDLGEDLSKDIEAWIKDGGVLLAQKRAAKWAGKQEWLKASFVSDKDIKGAFVTDGLRYGDREVLEGKQRIAGAVFGAELDVSHPLAFGIQETDIAFLRNSTLAMYAPDKPFITVSRYQDKPLLAGYASEELQKLLGGKVNLVAHRLGKGKVIGVTDTLAFRGYWYGTSRFISNALYLADFIDAEG
ncbi:M14 metallopeptidase family protein [Bowmanella dokdonensis]|uniref:Peptidase M14 n=1 Tax=Bowmanella dokdonensis TaxID=751969 RepID=A0A939IPJ9_9ALTE|nr:M14 metallopeptidase family protein [Bowmanella dokdonensis]MBN7823622.1 peptidase M14 [Bowmanella dokdonensis]